MIVKGYAAAKIMADFNTPIVKPGNKKIARNRLIYWDEATAEQREKLTWTTIINRGVSLKTAHISLTEEEKRMRAENEAYHNEQMYIYLLKNYGNDYASQFMEEVALGRAEELKKYPHCVYADGQCDIFCDFYKQGECIGGYDL